MDEAKRAFGADVAQSYVNHLVYAADNDDEDLREAHVRASALATVKALREKIDEDADDPADAWFAQHQVEILGLSDEHIRRTEDIRSLATEPQTMERRMGLEATTERVSGEPVCRQRSVGLVDIARVVGGDQRDRRFTLAVMSAE